MSFFSSVIMLFLLMCTWNVTLSSQVGTGKESSTLVPVVRQFFSNTEKAWLSNLPTRTAVASATINTNWKQAYLKKENFAEKSKVSVK
jgi:hypothetical protein